MEYTTGKEHFMMKTGIKYTPEGGKMAAEMETLAAAADKSRSTVAADKVRVPAARESSGPGTYDPTML